MRSHFFIEAIMLPLPEQIQVEIAEQRWDILLWRRHLSWQVIMLLWYCHATPDLHTHRLLQPLLPNKRDHLFALLLQHRSCSGLDIQTQERLSVGRAHIEPPVAIINRHPIEVIDHKRSLAEMVLNRFQLALDIADRSVDLATAHPCIQWFDQFRERLVLY